MTTQTLNIVKYNTQHPQHIRSATLPHADCCARLRASPHVSSELAYRPIRCRDTHPAASLPKKGVGRLPAYQHPPPTSLEGPQPNEQISAIKKWKTKFGGDRDKKKHDDKQYTTYNTIEVQVQ